MSEYDYDLFVIGGGSGGVRAARRTASLGHRVAIAEESRFGGTCVIRGCVPKKLYVYASNFPEAFEDAAGFGWNVEGWSHDWPRLRANKEAEITRLEGLYRKGLESNGVETFDTRAELRGPHEVWLKNEDRTVTAERILVAVGGRPNPHSSLPGHELCIDSDAAFDLERLPDKIVIAGGGYIAVEFAGIFAGLGCDVTILYRGEEILSGFDMDARKLLHASYENRGIKIVTHRVFDRIEELPDGRRKCTLNDGSVIEADVVMLALGRIPSTESLGLDRAGVRTDRKGNIEVDDYSRTNVPSVWAIGDVTARIELTPVAIHEAMCFVDTEFLDRPTKPDHEKVATAVFCHPELGAIGMAEHEAAEAYDRVDVYEAVFRPLKGTLSGRPDRTLMKVVVDADSDRVLGITILGDGAGELTQGLAIAVKMGATKADFDRTMAVHPTAAEELVTMYTPSYRLERGERLPEAA